MAQLNQHPWVLITGASSGLGAALAEYAAQHGARLLLVARRLQDMQALQARLKLSDQDCRLYPIDLLDQSAWLTCADNILQTVGTPDYVIASAGISVGMDPSDREDLQTLERTFTLNNIALAATFQPFIEPMRQRKHGHLIGIASMASIRGLPGHAAYCASKSAVVAYCESMRGDVKPFGIHVTTLVPGFIDTPMTQGNPYFMPFLTPADKFAQRAWKAILSQRSYAIIPWQMQWVARLLRILPDAWYDRIMRNRGRKPRAASSKAH